MDISNHFDVSSFLLLEASGDSEADSDPGMVVVEHADDDAESCSYDLSDCSGVSKPDDCDQVVHTEYVDDDCDQVVHTEYVDDEEEEEEEAVIYQTWAAEQQHAGFARDLKSSASVDSTQEMMMMSEVERNRLFWETCLAS